MPQNTCHSDEQWTRYSRDEIVDADRETLEQHLRQCVDCRETLQRIVAALSSDPAVPGDEPPGPATPRQATLLDIHQDDTHTGDRSSEKGADERAGSSPLAESPLAELKSDRTTGDGSRTLVDARLSSTPAPPATGSPRTLGDPQQTLGDLPLAHLPFDDRSVPSDEGDGKIGRLDDYDLEQYLARGGMGLVYKARETALDRTVVIKMLAPTLAENDVSRDRFVREARMVAAIQHPNVVAIYSVSEGRALPYIAMEWVDGGSLADRLDAGDSFPPEEIARIGSEIAAGLDAAHARGIIHRDIKPGNVLCDRRTGQIKLTDFGLAQTATDTRLTQTGLIAGTPGYLAPELLSRDSELDARSDLFSLGCVLYELASGRPPFRGETAMATLYQIANTSPPPPRELNADIPEWLDATIMALLNKDRERRPTAAEAKQAFDSTVRPTVAPGDSQQTTSHTDQQPAENRPASTAPPAFGTAHDTAADRSRRPKRLVSLTFGVLAIILIGLAARQWMRPPRVVVTTGAELKAAIESYDGRIHVAVRTNETLTVDPIVIAGLRRHVILTGAKGFHPVLVAADTTQPLLTAHGNRLELDAIELRSEADDVPLLYLENVQFSARQSRLAAHSTGGCIATVGDSVVELRDCELHGGSGHVFHLGEGLRPEVTLTNCIQSGTYAFTLEPNSSPTLTWERSTVFASHLFHVPVVRSTTAATNAETRRPTPSGDNTPADQVVIKSERSIVHADQSIMSGHWERAFRWKIYSQESRYVGPFAHEESDLASDLENSIRNERGSHLFAQPPQHIAVRIQTPHQLRHQDFQLRSDQLRQGKLRSMGVDFGNLRHLAAGEVRRLAK